MSRKCFILLTLVFGLSGASAFGETKVEQIFRPEIYSRGNVGLENFQPIDNAAWIWLDSVRSARGKYTPFVRFRCDFSADSSTNLCFDVSADARFVLMLDGREIARGPHKGVPNHWYYETYSVGGLSVGNHRLEAVVFDSGEQGPLSIISSGRNGFILHADGVYDGALTTGKAPWKATEITSVTFGEVTDPETIAGAETISVGTGFLDHLPADSEWREVSIVRPPIRTHEYGYHVRGWLLFPTERYDQMTAIRNGGVIRAVQESFNGRETRFSEADSTSRYVDAFNELKDCAKAVVIPARSKLRLLWDLGDYYCGYPILEVSGGNEAKICWSWTEGLYDDKNTRGNRDEFVGKRLYRSMDDTFICDGRSLARFTTPWWRSGRWVAVAIETGDAPITLTRLALLESRYPFECAARFECDDPSLDAVQRICVRGLQNCLHEMFMDCPYFEQVMYPGDTRIEMLTLNAIFGDDRMIRFGMGLFDYARRDDGMVPMSMPQPGLQDSATYSMCWAMMSGDYVLWHGTNDWLRARIPGLRHTLSVISRYENADGLVEGLPGWSFVDWVPEWGTYGNAPNGRRGLSSINNLLYVHALKSVARAEDALGDWQMANYWRDKAERIGAAIGRRFWCEKRGLLADTIEMDRFSEHAQCLALLADILPMDRRKRAFDGLLKANDLARATVYFSHYLFETYLKFDRSDLFLKRLDLWREYVKDGLKTPLEAPGVRARSDCHAWGAHPLYHLITGVAGVRPSENGYSKVLIEPKPGSLGFIRATAPTSKGAIMVDFDFSDGKVTGKVALPPGLQGEFRWKGRRMPLFSGQNQL